MIAHLSTWKEIDRLLDQKQYPLALREASKLVASYSPGEWPNETDYQTIDRIGKLHKYLAAYQEETK